MDTVNIDRQTRSQNFWSDLVDLETLLKEHFLNTIIILID